MVPMAMVNHTWLETLADIFRLVSVPKYNFEQSVYHFIFCFTHQNVHGEKQTQLINVYVDESFERDDLFRLFYSNHLLITAMSEGMSKKPSSPGSFK